MLIVNDYASTENPGPANLIDKEAARLTNGGNECI